MKFNNIYIFVSILLVLVYILLLKNKLENFSNISKSFIIIQPINGLCDRLQTILSWKVLAELLNKKLYIYWKPSTQFSHQKFQDLFINNFKLNFINDNTYKKLITKVNKKIILNNDFKHTVKTFTQMNKDNKIIMDGLVIKNIKKNKKFITMWDKRKKEGNNFLAKNTNLFYKGYLKSFDEPNIKFSKIIQKKYHSLQKKYTELMKKVTPAKPLHSQINKFVQNNMLKNGQIDKNIIGVHIRRGDTYKQFRIIYKKFGMYLKTDEQYIKDMNKEIKKNKNVKFFLATDDQKMLQKFKNLYKNRIIHFPQTFYQQVCKKNNCDLMSQYKKGQHFAIIDLFLLIKLKQIIGCYSSGFVRFYLIRNNIKLHKYMENTNQG